MSFRKFDKIARVPVPQYSLPLKKAVLSEAECKLLLSGEICIEEKLDGGNVAIMRGAGDPGYFLQKRGSLIGPSEHAQYRFFVNWAASNTDKLLRLPMGMWVYCELLYAKHNIFYDKLESYVVVTDVWDGDGYLLRSDKEDLCRIIGLTVAPLIYLGAPPKRDRLVKFIGNSAYYNGPMEGVVIKNYTNSIRGKIVRPEFMKEIEESDHWANKPVVKNLLRTGVEAMS